MGWGFDNYKPPPRPPGSQPAAPGGAPGGGAGSDDHPGRGRNKPTVRPPVKPPVKPPLTPAQVLGKDRFIPNATRKALDWSRNKINSMRKAFWLEYGVKDTYKKRKPPRRRRRARRVNRGARAVRPCTAMQKLNMARNLSRVAKRNLLGFAAGFALDGFLYLCAKQIEAQNRLDKSAVAGHRYVRQGSKYRKEYLNNSGEVIARDTRSFEYGRNGVLAPAKGVKHPTVLDKKK